MHFSRSSFPRPIWRTPVATFQSRRLFISLAYDVYDPVGISVASRQDAPVVFLHGLFGSKKNYRSVSKSLSRELQKSVFSIDLRNHGDSPHDLHHDYPSMAEDVEKFIEDHNIVNATLIGHSMGAKTAMTVALRSPDLLSSLISVDNAPVDAVLNGDFAKYVQGMKKVEEIGPKKQADADSVLISYEKSLPIRQFLLTNLVRDSVSGHLKFRIPLKTLAAALDNMADFPFRNPEEARFEKPTLFIRGTNSHYIADESLPVIGQFFPLFKLCDIEAGHWVISEKPQDFINAVVEFLKE